MIDKIIETAWVMWNYKFAEAVVGMAACILLALTASRCRRRGMVLMFCSASILALWLGLFLAAETSNAIWQQAPHAPVEGFSKSGPLMVFYLGWIPGLFLSAFFVFFSRLMLPMDGITLRATNHGRQLAKPTRAADTKKESRARWAYGYHSGHGPTRSMQS